METSAWWFIAAAVLGIGQIFAVDIAFGLLAVAALIVGIMALLGLPAIWSILVFAVIAVALVLSLRRPLMRKFKTAEPVVTGAAALVGERALAIDTVTTRSGRVKIRGEVWTARTRDGELAEDALGRVTAIDGATAIVAPEEE